MAPKSSPYPAHVPLFIPSWDAQYGGAFSLVATTGSLGGNPGGANWPTANLAIYIPLLLPWNYPVKRVFLANGNPVAGNFDIGIYREDKSLLVSLGATAQSGTSVIQYATVDWLIPAGAYFMGLSLSSATAQAQRFTTGVNVMRYCGCTQQATAHPLPSTMAPATIANTYWPLFGITRTSSGF